MSNFDFLKNFNEELYEIGMKLEEDVLDSPRAVTADATLFLETLVKDIYRQTNHKLKSSMISFYKKVDNLYRLGAITYIYKNKLQEAYNLRNKIHKNYKNEREESKLAFDIHQRLYYISKKYFQDYCDNQRYISIPEYRRPAKVDINFKKCIICGNEKQDLSSNMCIECRSKAESLNLLLSLKGRFSKSTFTRQDLVESGLNESDSISLLMNLSKDNIISKRGDDYCFNEVRFKSYIDDVSQYVEISRLITQFYKDEITASEIKSTLEYWKGSIHQKPYTEFYRLVSSKLERDFERNLCDCENIKKSMKLSCMDQFNVQEWFCHEKEAFLKGSINDAFVLYNDLLINEFFSLKKKGLSDEEILTHEAFSLELFEFWKSDFMGNDFFKKTTDIKRSLIIKELRKNRYLSHALKNAGVSKAEFDKLYMISKKSDDLFYRSFQEEYVHKRQRIFLKNLRHNSLKKAIRMCKITKGEFVKWYFQSEIDMSEFYLKSTELLMEKYLFYRRTGWNKKHILKHMNITKDMFSSWLNHDELELFRDFRTKNNEITGNLVKRGLVINGLKEGKSKEEAIFSAGLTPKEFLDIYNASKKDKNDFHLRFDEEYVKNRQRLFVKLIRENDFYNAIEKCEISQTDFNRWYLRDQNRFISYNQQTEFYTSTTSELMDKYLKARWSGKNKPDAARSVGLSNIVIGKWIKHSEFDMFYEFKKKNKQLTMDLIVKGFNEGKSKGEVSEIYDISLKTIEEYIELGKRGHIKYAEIHELYEGLVIPSQLAVFYQDFKTKPFARALKNSKLTGDELDYYYGLGKSGDERFMEFHRQLLDLKIKIYVDNILAKKSSKIALKNSKLLKQELEENKSEIDNSILHKRMEIICESLSKHKTNGSRLAQEAGISIKELYSWYFRGRDGEVEFKEFYLVFELGMVFPRVVAYNKALSMGLPKNWLTKQLKKDLGAKDFSIWQENDILNQCDMKCIRINGDEVDKDKIMGIINNFKFAKTFSKDKNQDAFEFMKNAFWGNQKFSESLINLSSEKDMEKNKKEIRGE